MNDHKKFELITMYVDENKRTIKITSFEQYVKDDLKLMVKCHLVA